LNFITGSKGSYNLTLFNGIPLMNATAIKGAFSQIVGLK
jgi:hypothetical protein